MNTLTSDLKQPSLLQAVLEGFIDGILILTDQGEWLHANDCARQICSQLIKNVSQTDRVPQEIWRVCQCLLESSTFYSNKTVMIEDEITTSHSASYRLRAQWLKLDLLHRPCFLVTLEDRLQSTRSAAIAEGHRYKLTPREVDVWLRYRSNYSYKEIASDLFITLNTVKKHMKSIHAKKQLALVSNE